MHRQSLWMMRESFNVLILYVAKRVFLVGNVRIPINILLTYVPKNLAWIQHWLVQIKIGAKQATSHHLDKWLLRLLVHTLAIQCRWVKTLNEQYWNGWIDSQLQINVSSPMTDAMLSRCYYCDQSNWALNISLEFQLFYSVENIFFVHIYAYTYTCWLSI